MSSPLPSATLCDVGLAADPLDRLFRIIDEHVATGRYPGAQIAIARQGELAVVKTFGDRVIQPARMPALDDTLWLLYSNTKVLTACAVWLLVERGALRFTDAVAAHVPDFKKHGKGEITVIQLLTHRGGSRTPTCPRRCGRITSCSRAPCATSRSSGCRAARFTTTAARRTGPRPS